MVKIAPSILSADFCNLERDIRGAPPPPPPPPPPGGGGGGSVIFMAISAPALPAGAAAPCLSRDGAAGRHLFAGGNMDVITISSLVQHGLINRGRIFTFSVQLPDRPGELLRIADLVARLNS